MKHVLLTLYHNNEPTMGGYSNHIVVSENFAISTFDFIISTIPANYEPLEYVKMLKMGGEMAVVGLPNASAINIVNLAFVSRRKVYGSLIGGIKETQGMLDYSVAHNIYPEVETIEADAKTIDKAYRNVMDGKVKFRYVIDMSTIK